MSREPTLSLVIPEPISRESMNSKFVQKFWFLRKYYIIVLSIVRRWLVNLSTKKTPCMGSFFDYLPKYNSNASRALQMEKDSTILIEEKVKE